MRIFGWLRAPTRPLCVDLEMAYRYVFFRWLCLFLRVLFREMF